MYKLTETGVLRLEDQAWIPDCADNRDWVEYQQWLSVGNAPEPMDVYDSTKSDYLEFFNKEKVIALRIEEGYRLDLEPVTEQEMGDVKRYLKSISPTSVTKDSLERPEIMDRYSQLNTTLEE